MWSFLLASAAFVIAFVPIVPPHHGPIVVNWVNETGGQPNQQLLTGQVWWANLEPVEGEEIPKKRPVAIYQNDHLTSKSATVAVVPLTSTDFATKRECEKLRKNPVALQRIRPGPTHPTLQSPSIILADQLRVIDKSRIDLTSMATTLTATEMTVVSGGIRNMLEPTIADEWMEDAGDGSLGHEADRVTDQTTGATSANLVVRAGEIYRANLKGGQGGELADERPVLVVQRNDLSLRQSTVLVLPLEKDDGQTPLAESLLGVRFPRLNYGWLTWPKAIVRVDAIRAIDVCRFTSALPHRVSKSEYNMAVDAIRQVVSSTINRPDNDEASAWLTYILFQFGHYMVTGELATGQ